MIQKWRTRGGQRVGLVAPCSEPWCFLSTPAAKQTMTRTQISRRSLWTYCIDNRTLKRLSISSHHHCVMEFFPLLPLCPAPLPLLLQRALQSCNMSLQVLTESRNIFNSALKYLVFIFVDNSWSQCCVYSETINKQVNSLHCITLHCTQCLPAGQICKVNELL